MRLVQRHGGNCTPAPHIRSLTHIIAVQMNGSKTNKLLNRAGSKIIPVVHPDWILDSIKAKKLLPDAKYRILKDNTTHNMGEYFSSNNSSSSSSAAGTATSSSSSAVGSAAASSAVPKMTRPTSHRAAAAAGCSSGIPHQTEHASSASSSVAVALKLPAAPLAEVISLDDDDEDDECSSAVVIEPAAHVEVDDADCDDDGADDDTLLSRTAASFNGCSWANNARVEGDGSNDVIVKHLPSGAADVVGIGNHDDAASGQQVAVDSATAAAASSAFSPTSAAGAPSAFDDADTTNGAADNSSYNDADITVAISGDDGGTDVARNAAQSSSGTVIDCCESRHGLSRTNSKPRISLSSLPSSKDTSQSRAAAAAAAPDRSRAPPTAAADADG